MTVRDAYWWCRGHFAWCDVRAGQRDACRDDACRSWWAPCGGWDYRAGWIAGKLTQTIHTTEEMSR